MSTRTRGCLLALLLSALIIFAYRPAWNGGFIWDDDVYITNNALLTAPDGLRKIWFSLEVPSQYFPLVYTTFRIERALWGLNPTGYHWVNLLLHVANALLVWRLLARLKIPGGWLAAAIFALHPVQVESVAWITERKNVLMGFFFLLTLLAWIEFIDLEKAKRWVYYAAALFFYLLALSAKSTACTLPAALLLILWLKKKPVRRETLLQLLPFVVLAAGMGLLAVWWERYHQRTRLLLALEPVERLLVASHAIWFYLGKLLWPAKLTFSYPKWKLDVGDPFAYGWMLATVVLCAVIWITRRFVGRSVEVAALFFVTTLAPLIGFIMLYTFRYTFVADHYQYLACIGPVTLAATGIAQFRGRIKYRRELVWSVSVLIVGALWLLTWQQSAIYRDVEILWKNTIARNPSGWMAYNNLGIVLAGRGEVDQAISQYKKSLELYSEDPEAHYNLGSALLKKGEADEAIAQCREAIRLRPRDADAHVALGNALLTKNDVDDAIAEYSKALEIWPADTEAYCNLGAAFLSKGDAGNAEVQYKKALWLQPDIVEAHVQLGNILLRRGDFPHALAEYDSALRIAPQNADAQLQLAWILACAPDDSLRNGPRALNLAQHVSQSPTIAESVRQQVLAAAYAESRQFEKAVEVARSALESASSRGDSAQADELRRQLQLYQSGSVYHEP